MIDTVPDRTSSDRCAWWMLVALLLSLFALQVLDPFAFAPGEIAGLLVSIAALNFAGLFYTYAKPKPQFAATCAGLQQMILFCAVAAILSYMTAARAGPLWDTRLLSWDIALGLNWVGYLSFIDSFPAAAALLKFAYMTLIPQMIILIIALGFARRFDALRICIAAAILAGGVTVALSGFVPAVGYFAHLDLAPDHFEHIRPAAGFVHLADFTGLRDGSLRGIEIGKLEGIVTFPSYHAALATVFAWGFLQAPLVRWPGFGMAVLTLFATPIDGGHYFVDVIAGTLIALAALYLCRKLIFLDLRPARLLPVTLIPPRCSSAPVATTAAVSPVAEEQ